MSDRAVALAGYALAAAGLVLLVLPPVGLGLRAPWTELAALAADPGVQQAVVLSLVVSAVAVALALVTGLPLAWLLARRSFPGRALLRTLVTLPMVMPPVVAGVGLLAAFGATGLAGRPLAAFGVFLPFSTAAAVLAAAFVSAPFLVTMLEAGIRQSDERLEEVAATLGASRWLSFRAVLLPAIRPSLGAGIALAWARALGEFGATITFAGNLEGRTQTVPLAIYQMLQNQPERAFLLGAVWLLVSLLLLLALRGRGLVR